MSRNIPSPDKPFWDEEKLVEEIKVSDASKYTVSACEKDEKHFISVTRWYTTKKSPDWKPKNGIVLPADKAHDIANAIKLAAKE